MPEAAPKRRASALVVMGRFPRAGAVKTRLVPALGEEGAAVLYRACLEDVLEQSRAAPADRYCFVAPPESTGWFETFAPGFVVRAQSGEDLGARMATCFEELFGEGYEAVVLRNSDSPALPPERVRDAFTALESGAEVVLGPDEGGGYYLVGLRAPWRELFGEVAMSRRSTFDTTRDLVARSGRSLATLAPCWDLDVPDDLEHLAELARGGGGDLCPRTMAWWRSWRGS